MHNIKYNKKAHGIIYACILLEQKHSTTQHFTHNDFIIDLISPN